MKISKTLAMLTALSLGTLGASASTGIFGSYIQIGSTWYGMTEWGTDVANFQGATLGSYTAGSSETISDFEIHTFKNGNNAATEGNDVTGAAYEWRVNQVTPSVVPGSFVAVNSGFTANSPFTGAANTTLTGGGGDQNWSAVASTPNFLSGLSAGTYTLEIFSRASTQDSAGPTPTPTVFSNNGGANFIANFTVVPEPATLALFGMGMVGLAVARRRRA